MSTSEPGFHAVLNRALKREGVKGKRAAVTLSAGRLGIAGEDGGAISIDLADIASMRVGYDESKYAKYFRTRIVRTSRPAPSSSIPSPPTIRTTPPPSAPWRRPSCRPAASAASSADRRLSGPGWGQC
jgi:hypothetical protein